MAPRPSTRRPRPAGEDRADGNFRIDVEDEPARRADQPFRFGRLEQPPFEWTPAARAVAVGERVVVHRASINFGYVDSEGGAHGTSRPARPRARAGSDG